MRESPSIFALPLLAAMCLAAATAPATSTASAPQTAARAALGALFRSILSADEKSTLDLLVFADADSRASAEAMLRRIIATARLRRAIVHQFDAKGQDSTVGRKQEQEEQDLLNLLGSATVVIKGDAAEIALGNGQVFQMVLKEGSWKVDFDKSQQGMGGLPSKMEVDAAKRQTKAIDQLAVDVAARKWSLIETEAIYSAIMAAPATAPAPGTRP